MESSDHLLTPRECQRRGAFGKSTFFNLAKSGALPTVKIGRSTRVRASDFQAWLDGLSAREGAIK